MNPNLLDQAVRKRIIDDIHSNENRRRKVTSFRMYEIFKDHIHRYVYEYLNSQFGKRAADCMPIISSINIAKRVVLEEATIYSCEPTRTFGNLTGDTDLKAIEAVYSDGRFNSKYQRANEYFKLYKGQVVTQTILIDKKLEKRVLLPHHIDVIPDAANPEKAYAYIISSFDKSQYLKSDGSNEVIADRDDYKASLERYTVWTDELNFTMDGKGNFVPDSTGVINVDNPIGILPFCDIATDKDYEFFIRPGETDTDFTIQYNGALSDLQNIVRRQGYAQAVYQGNVELFPETIELGPMTVLKIPIDPQNPTQSEFKFATPSPDITGSIKSLELMLANYLTTRGIDTKAIAANLSGSSTYGSGVERLLALIERFEAARDDFSIFEAAENHDFEIMKAWLTTYSGSDLLDKKYWVGASAEQASLSVKYSEPKDITSVKDQNENLLAEMEMGIADRVYALMVKRELSEEDAIEELQKIDERKKLYDPPDEPLLANPMNTGIVNETKGV